MRPHSGKYTVLVDDNYHYQDEGQRYKLGSFDALDEAIGACKKLVDDWLEDNHEPGMTPGDLCGKYKMFGEDPFIVCEGCTDVLFSAWDYAEKRCEEICKFSGRTKEDPDASKKVPDQTQKKPDKPAPRRASARRFNYYDDWKTENLTCPECGWQGTFEEGDTEYYQELMDSSCPRCDSSHILAIVPYPTYEEARENWDKLSDEERKSWKERREFLDRLERERLKSPDQLPDIDDEQIYLVWDTVDDLTDPVTYIRHRDRVLWKEPAVYEGASRFGQVLDILESKYGPRLVDLKPSGSSGLFLYGDQISSIGRVRELRRRLRERSVAPGSTRT